MHQLSTNRPGPEPRVVHRLPVGSAGGDRVVHHRTHVHERLVAEIRHREELAFLGSAADPCRRRMRGCRRVAMGRHHRDRLARARPRHRRSSPRRAGSRTATCRPGVTTNDEPPSRDMPARNEGRRAQRRVHEQQARGSCRPVAAAPGAPAVAVGERDEDPASSRLRSARSAESMARWDPAIYEEWMGAPVPGILWDGNASTSTSCSTCDDSNLGRGCGPRCGSALVPWRGCRASSSRRPSRDERCGARQAAPRPAPTSRAR